MRSVAKTHYFDVPENDFPSTFGARVLLSSLLLSSGLWAGIIATINSIA